MMESVMPSVQGPLPLWTHTMVRHTSHNGSNCGSSMRVIRHSPLTTERKRKLTPNGENEEGLAGKDNASWILREETKHAKGNAGRP